MLKSAKRKAGSGISVFKCFGVSVWRDGRVVLAPQRFTETGPEGLRLQPYAGRLLQFATGVTLRPKADYFARHSLVHDLT
jgi:hypothetical protein